jgi:hypothetical protein
MKNGLGNIFLRYIEKSMVSNQKREDIDCWDKDFNVVVLEEAAFDVCDEEFNGVERLQIRQEIRVIAAKYRDLAGTPF